jgi:malate permease and related proteins
MNSLLLLLVCLALGMLVTRYGHAPAGLAPALNWWVLNVALTALILHLIPQLSFSWDLWFLVFAMWAAFLGAWGVCAAVGRAAQWTRARIGALTLVCGISNTAFIGFPFVEALRGQAGLQLAIIVDQAGSFMVFALGGTLIAAIYTGRTVSLTGVLKNVAQFPPFIALWIGVGAGALGGWPELLDSTFQRLGASLTPLALFSVGLQLRLVPRPGQALPLAVGLGWKLLFAPAFVYALGTLFGVHGLERTVAVLESAMAPAIGAGIVCQQQNLEPELANTVLGLGILLSLFTVQLVNALLP